MANEPDRDKRERIDQVRVELTEEHLNPLYAEGVRIVRDGVERLDAPNYAELYRRFGFRLDELATSAARCSTRPRRSSRRRRTGSSAIGSASASTKRSAGT